MEPKRGFGVSGNILPIRPPCVRREPSNAESGDMLPKRVTYILKMGPPTHPSLIQNEGVEELPLPLGVAA
ncbi:hypothetical protein ARGLB_064_00650 [Arthrobacter globiformis NBRC 12137]|uniref:Uncharacterized protein n=1 Tax=Arthrobacter globiformis (strain ATCC 8010 / DSM 20124 / JCM 1332 / NBRC 12137 / NCIMB 8907 / NRRL B-2979 / 168) TaxID=1077972 RepID=H0QNA2_ARTG1|nr:hypothetical protein ARGLB_064_00650 [Arthrobacter globiformis NBRC 12137]